ncbi:MAG: phage baseplate assembly protein V [Anaerolineales bacterium]
MIQSNGVTIGIVKEIDSTLGRIKVEFPLMQPPQRSNWARIASLMGGKKRGAFFMPEIDDEVLLAFDQGDFDHPYVVGFLWNGVDPSPETNPRNRVIVTPGGHTLRFEDTEGAKKVILKSSGEHQIIIDDSEQTVTVTTKGLQSIVLDDKGSGSIKLQGGGRILEMSNGQVQIT